MDPATSDKPIALAASKVAALKLSKFVKPAISEKTGKAAGKSVWKIFGIPASVGRDKPYSNFFHFLKVIA